MEDFYKLAQQVRKERLTQERHERKEKEIQGYYIWVNFTVWCCVWDCERTEQNFAKFLKEEKQEINFWQKKWILENKFGYTSDYNYDTEKWSFKKD